MAILQPVFREPLQDICRNEICKASFKKLIQPAIDLAENGFAITESQAKSFNDTKDEFIKLNTTIPVFVKDAYGKQEIHLFKKILPIH